MKRMKGTIYSDGEKRQHLNRKGEESSGSVSQSGTHSSGEAVHVFHVPESQGLTQAEHIHLSSFQS